MFAITSKPELSRSQVKKQLKSGNLSKEKKEKLEAMRAWYDKQGKEEVLEEPTPIVTAKVMHRPAPTPEVGATVAKVLKSAPAPTPNTLKVIKNFNSRPIVSGGAKIMESVPNLETIKDKLPAQAPVPKAEIHVPVGFYKAVIKTVNKDSSGNIQRFYATTTLEDGTMLSLQCNNKRIRPECDVNQIKEGAQITFSYGLYKHPKTQHERLCIRDFEVIGGLPNSVQSTLGRFQSSNPKISLMDETELSSILLSITAADSDELLKKFEQKYRFVTKSGKLFVIETL